MYDLSMPPGPMLSMGQDQPAEQPQSQQPSIIDRVLGKLYPAGAFGHLLPPDQLADERRMALRGAGLHLLAGAGPRPLNAPPHNFGADLEEALNPEGWQKHLAGVAQTGMQLQAMMKKQQDEEKFRQIMAANPAPVGTTETRQQFADRLGRISAASIDAGLVEHAKATGELIKEVTPGNRNTEVRKMPDGSTALVDKNTGDIVKSWAPGTKPDYTPEEKAKLTFTARQNFGNEIAPADNQLKAFKAFNAAPWGGVNDALKLANAIKVVVPSSGVTSEQVLSGQAASEFGGLPILGPLLKSFHDGKELDLGARTAIRDYVQQQVPNITANVNSLIQRHQQWATEMGLEPNQVTYNPTAGETSMIPVGAGDQKDFEFITNAAKKRKPL